MHSAPTAGPAVSITEPIRVALVDDQQLVRSGFTMLINSQPDLEVVIQAGNGNEALAGLAATAADVVLMDVRMPSMDGIETARQLMERTRWAAAGSRLAELKVVVLTTFDLDEYALAAMRGVHADRAGAVQSRDRRAPVPVRGHG